MTIHPNDEENKIYAPNDLRRVEYVPVGGSEPDSPTNAPETGDNTALGVAAAAAVAAGAAAVAVKAKAYADEEGTEE